MENPPKKVINEAVFIPKSARILTIIHLCLVFAYLSWHFLGPYFSSHFERKSQTAIVLSLMGDPSLSDYVGGISTEKISLLQRHSERFRQLSKEDQAFLELQYARLANLQKGPESISFSRLTQDFLNTPIYLFGWIVFSIMLCFLILLRIEGAVAASFLIPILAFAYSFSNFTTAPLPSPAADTHLFPSEDTILTHYIYDPLPEDIALQQEMLKSGWEAYLLDKWGGETRGNDSLKFNKALAIEDAEYRFTLARFRLLSKEPSQVVNTDTRLSPLLLLCFVLWSLCFASSINTIKARSEVW